MKRSGDGYILLPVVIVIAVIATIAYLNSRESGLALNATTGEIESQQLNYLTQAAMQHALRDANQGACNGYGLPLTSFQNHSYEANFTPDNGSPVAITAIGTLQNGASRSLSRQAIRIYQAEIVQIYQPGAGEGKDSSLHGGSQAGKNYGASSPIWIDNLVPHHGVFQFDLSGIAPLANILDAQLEVYVESIDDVTSTEVSLHRLTQAWVEGTGDSSGSPADGADFNTYDSTNAWASAGGDYDPVAAASITVSSGNASWYQWSIAELVGDWVAGTQANYGFLMLGGSTGVLEKMRVASSDSPDATKHPRLTVTYVCECGVSGSSSNRELTSDVDTYVATGSNPNLSTTNFGNNLRLTVGNHTNIERSLLYFDLSTIPVAATITSATLELNYEGSGTLTDGTIEVYRIDTDWLELEATWDIPQTGQAWSGGSFDTTLMASNTVSESEVNQFIPFLVGDLVRSWHDGSQLNQGLLLSAIGGAGYGTGRFTSSDNANNTLHPRLTVNYTCPCGVDCS